MRWIALVAMFLWSLSAGAVEIPESRPFQRGCRDIIPCLTDLVQDFLNCLDEEKYSPPKLVNIPEFLLEVPKKNGVVQFETSSSSVIFRGYLSVKIEWYGQADEKGSILVFTPFYEKDADGSLEYFQLLERDRPVIQYSLRSEQAVQDCQKKLQSQQK